MLLSLKLHIFLQSNPISPYRYIIVYEGFVSVFPCIYAVFQRLQHI